MAYNFYTNNNCLNQNLQRTHLFRLTFDLGVDELNTKYATFLQNMSLRVKEFKDEKTIVFDEFEDMSTVRFFDLWGGSFPCKIKLTLFNMNLNKASYEKDYCGWLTMRPMSFSTTSNDSLKIYADFK